MDDKIKKLKKRFRNVRTDSELDVIDKEMDVLSKEPDFQEKMLASIQDTNKKLEEILLKEKLGKILPAISVSYISKQYFQKTPQWFYQRLNGNVVNGKPAKFSNTELDTLRLALTDISKELMQSVNLIF